MRFDKKALRWVKRAGEESDDPFRDIESVGGSGSMPVINHPQSEDLTISFEESAQRVIDALTGELDYSSNLSSDEEQRDAVTETAHLNPRDHLGVPLPQSFSTPVGARLHPRSTIPTPIRSAMKVTPVNTQNIETGSSTGKLRSVSFSDGRRSGPIRGLHQDMDPSEDPSVSNEGPSQFEEKRSLLPSFRTKRIGDLLDNLGETSREEEEENEEEQTPCKSSSQQRSMVGSLLGASIGGSGSSLGLSAAAAPLRFTERSVRGRDATFLTECSFGVAHDRLLECITDVQPFEPHWEELGSIDLSGKKLDSLARLKEFMPKLEELIMLVAFCCMVYESLTFV